MAEEKLHLFKGFGVELEYMIVRNGELDVFPIADTVLKQVAGCQIEEVERGPLGWSNELVLHVIELKTNGPVSSLNGLAESFQHDVAEINAILKPLGGCLMPTAMHPWMQPLTETRLWPHGNRTIYETYNRIFDCRGHGWSNLQSAHLNLAFADDAEFARLHAAVRLLLPLIPAMAASSPILEGRLSGMMDTRLRYYLTNQRRVPMITGTGIPEPVYSRQAYEETILQSIYRDVAPHDPAGTLQFEWLNSRGAIARFDRYAIEIRLLDIQECPAADLAIAEALVSFLKDISSERWSPWQEQADFPGAVLAAVLQATIQDGENAVVTDQGYLRHLGYQGETAQARDLLAHLVDRSMAAGSAARQVLDLIVARGPLSRRIRKAVGRGVTRERVYEVYDRLCDCLAKGEMFLGL